MLDESFEPHAFEGLAAWRSADPAPALAAFRRSAERLLAGAVRTGPLGVPVDAFLPAAAAALDSRRSADPRRFFEDHFAPALIRPRADEAKGFLTGYYEPVLPASRRPTARFTAPLHRRPADLHAVPAKGRPAGLDPALTFARQMEGGGWEPFPDRGAIARGALAGQGLEIAYLESEAEAFFVHVQGSARLLLADGAAIRVGYSGKSGHPYTAIGRVLVERGELELAEADMSGLRRWLAAHPHRVREILDENRSYIFFSERAVREDEGPVGAAGVPLTAMGSVALDGSLHTYGMPVFVAAPSLRVAGEPFHGLLVAQDTGSAIRGAARGDLFCGSGEEAGRLAGTIRHAADFYALLPKGLVAAWRR